MRLDKEEHLDKRDILEIASWQKFPMTCSFCGVLIGYCQHAKQLMPYNMCLKCKDKYEH